MYIHKKINKNNNKNKKIFPSISKRNINIELWHPLIFPENKYKNYYNQYTFTKK